jgi:hypothetical protein
MTFYDELKGAALDAYNRALRETIDLAQRQLGLTREQLTVRPLRPEDLGLTNPNYLTTMAPTAWTPIVSSQTIADNRFVMIYGVYNNELVDELQAIRIRKAGQDTRDWNIIGINQLKNKTGYADDPLIIEQNTVVNIEGYARTGSTIEDFALLGVVVEKKGLVVAATGMLV